MDAHSPVSAGIGRPDLLPVHLEVWGCTRRDAQAAADIARGVPGRAGWGFDDERTVVHEGGVCTLKLENPRALASAQGFGWAYLVTLADSAAPGGEAS